MPNFKIFQDTPDQARIKIFGSQDLAFSQDSSGNLGITSTGLAITPPADGLAITSTGLAITPPADGLMITSTGLSITPPAAGLTVTAPAEGLSITPPLDGLAITSTGLAITPPAGGLMITSTGLAVQTATTDVSEILGNITDTAGSPATTYEVLNFNTWTLGVVNASTTIAPAVVKLQISPDGIHWLDNAGPVTLNTGDVTALVSSLFLKYARVYYAAVNAASAVTLNIFFQGKA
ncbi:MAG: DUF6385 domain-containing protein [Thermacetogeniaceae bacterium]